MSYDHDNILPYQHSSLNKKEQVALMFNHIAKNYDRLNRLLSFRIDVLWRRTAIRKMQNLPHAFVLDIATGTGDLAIQIAKKMPTAKVIGIDIATEMLAFAKQKIAKENLSSRIEMQTQDAEELNFKNHTFDLASVAFGIRNFQNLNAGLAEISRVLKPNGTLIILEFSTPQKKIIQLFYRLYATVFIDFLGRLISKDKNAYAYLNKSSAAFPEPSRLKEILFKHQFKDVTVQPLTFGICTLYVAKK